MGGPEKIRRQREAGRLAVRERIAALLDEGSFHEVGALAGTARYDESGELASFVPANFVTGTGRLDGRKVVVGGDDFTVRGGAALTTADLALDLRRERTISPDPQGDHLRMSRRQPGEDPCGRRVAARVPQPAAITHHNDGPGHGPRERI